MVLGSDGKIFLAHKEENMWTILMQVTDIKEQVIKNSAEVLSVGICPQLFSTSLLFNVRRLQMEVSTNRIFITYKAISN